MIKRIILATASVVALSAAANAADMYRAGPSYKDTPYVGVNWSGLYVGANGGYGSFTDDHNNNGGIAGGQIGYNIQRGNIVFGLETDLEDMSGSANNSWFGTARGRVGYAIDRALVYGTGGYAYGGCDGCSNLDGWAAGGGVEYKFNPSWSAKAEYQRVEMTSTPANQGIDTFRIGVNYFVGGGYDPLK
jgi:outer membrane immunogenic protein